MFEYLRFILLKPHIGIWSGVFSDPESWNPKVLQIILWRSTADLPRWGSERVCSWNRRCDGADWYGIVGEFYHLFLLRLPRPAHVDVPDKSIFQVQLPSYNYAKSKFIQYGLMTADSTWTFLASSFVSGACVVSEADFSFNWPSLLSWHHRKFPYSV